MIKTARFKKKKQTNCQWQLLVVFIALNVLHLPGDKMSLTCTYTVYMATTLQCEVLFHIKHISIVTVLSQLCHINVSDTSNSLCSPSLMNLKSATLSHSTLMSTYMCIVNSVHFIFFSQRIYGRRKRRRRQAKAEKEKTTPPKVEKETKTPSSPSVTKVAATCVIFKFLLCF